MTTEHRNLAERKQKKIMFFKNALLLSCVNIVLRGLGVTFNAYINRKIGAEGMGLYTLVMSVYGFAVTLALSCVNLGAMKLTSERCVQLTGTDKHSWQYGMRSLVLMLCLYGLLFGMFSAMLMYFSSYASAKYLLNDMRTLRPLRILSLSLPFISLSSAFSGFFTGLRKVSKNAISAITEQFLKIVFISTGLYLVSGRDVADMCLALVAGSTLTEILSFSVNLIMYLTDTKRPKGELYGKKQIRIKTKFTNVTSISFVAAIGTYARQGLTTLEHLAIPIGLKKSGLDERMALASYGLLQGIAFPLVMFPYAVIGSFTSLLVPEIAEKCELGDSNGIKVLTSEVYRYSAIFSLGACGIFVLYGKSLGDMIYSSTEAAVYTSVLGLLVPFMYLDTAVDSLLKGLGEQLYNMRVNIADAAAGLLLVMLLTPKMGIWGYICTVWLCEVGNLIASISRLTKKTGVSIGNAFSQYVLPFAVTLISAALKFTLLDHFVSSEAISILIYALFYLVTVEIIEKRRRKEK